MLFWPLSRAARTAHVFAAHLLIVAALAPFGLATAQDTTLAPKPSAAGTTERPASTKPSSPTATSKKASTKKTAKKKSSGKGAKGGAGATSSARGGALGRHAGGAHLAFKDAGSDLDSLWPPKMPAPLPGSILPAKRVIAYYGNPLSRRMGILGEFDPPEMLRRLDTEVAAWNRLDPAHPVQPALHLIAVVAQGAPGRDGKYRLRMDSTLIEKVYGWAKSKNAILFLDVQVGQSTLQQELPALARFLKRPDVHLGIDPEFSMKDGSKPGKKIGTFDAADINYATKFLAELVTQQQLPPKILVVHRFTRKGVTNANKIALDPRVQFVMHMDGFGAPWLKRDSYYSYIKQEPVQFAGWKQFTKAKNDNPATPREEIVRLWPQPVYIQIQ
ncbi:MAG: hypothetical protein SFW08_07050 [Gemmatimonadaceae bacterium]|nr:hypothetical protein [Gemmatimonadaceae bacterium]